MFLRERKVSLVGNSLSCRIERMFRNSPLLVFISMRDVCFNAAE